MRISPMLRPSSTSHRRDKLPSLANPEPVAIGERDPLDCSAEATDLRLLRPREYSSNAPSAQSRSSTRCSPANCSNSLDINIDDDEIESFFDIDNDEESSYSSLSY